MRPIFLLLFISVSTALYSQGHNMKNNYLKFSAGRVLFGTGDVTGFSVNVEGAKQIIKSSKPFLNKLLVGGELSFENGVKNPVTANPTNEEFISKTFYQVSN